VTEKLDIHSLDDLSKGEIEELLAVADKYRDVKSCELLKGKAIILLFLSPSLRTRVSMERAAQQLGADVVTLQAGASLWQFEIDEGLVMDGAAAEHMKEASRVLARYGDLIAVRAFPAKESWEEDARDRVHNGFMRWAPVPILNLESSLYHPCQSLADLMTMGRAVKDGVRGKVVLSWCNHPKALPVAVPNSFALAATQMGWDLTITHPEGYELPKEIISRCEAHAESNGQSLTVTSDRGGAFKDAQFVYAKSWGRLDCYGQSERELSDRQRRGLASWIVDEDIMSQTKNAWFMHCLPVRRNVVVSDGVIDGPRSLVFEQAENRLHGQKALLLKQLGMIGSH
jgi:N-acetylornithine carbamoyltransferase